MKRIIITLFTLFSVSAGCEQGQGGRPGENGRPGIQGVLCGGPPDVIDCNNVINYRSICTAQSEDFKGIVFVPEDSTQVVACMGRDVVACLACPFGKKYNSRWDSCEDNDVIKGLPGPNGNGGTTTATSTTTTTPTTKKKKFRKYYFKIRP